MRRRAFIALVGSAAAQWPLAAPAQSTKMLRVGTASLLSRTEPLWIAFEKKLATLGYREGQNFIFDFVQPSGFEGLNAAYRAVVARQPDGPTAQSIAQSIIDRSKS